MQSWDNDAAEAAFAAWLQEFRETLPDRTMMGVFLSADHLRKAFMAGLHAAEAEEATCDN